MRKWRINSKYGLLRSPITGLDCAPVPGHAQKNPCEFPSQSFAMVDRVFGSFLCKFSPMSTIRNFWYGSDKNSTGTKSSGTLPLFTHIKELYFIVLVPVPSSETSVCRRIEERFLPQTYARSCFNMADLVFLLNILRRRCHSFHPSKERSKFFKHQTKKKIRTRYIVCSLHLKD